MSRTCHMAFVRRLGFLVELFVLLSSPFSELFVVVVSSKLLGFPTPSNNLLVPARFLLEEEEIA